MRNSVALSLLSALAGSVLFAAPATSAQVTAVRTIPVQIHLGNMPGSGRVQVYLEIAQDISKLGIPQRLDGISLTSIPVRRTGTLQIRLPVTKLVLAHTSSGLATYMFTAWFGDHRAVSEASVPVAPRPGNAAAAMAGSAVTIMFSPFENVPKPPPGPPPPCIFVARGRAVEKTNKMGR